MKQKLVRGFYQRHSIATSTSKHFSKYHISKVMQRSWYFGRFYWAVWVEAHSNLCSNTGVVEQPSACPAGHSLAVFNQKDPQLLANFRPYPAK